MGRVNSLCAVTLILAATGQVPAGYIPIADRPEAEVRAYALAVSHLGIDGYEQNKIEQTVIGNSDQSTWLPTAGAIDSVTASATSIDGPVTTTSEIGIGAVRAMGNQSGMTRFDRTSRASNGAEPTQHQFHSVVDGQSYYRFSVDTPTTLFIDVGSVANLPFYPIGRFDLRSDDLGATQAGTLFRGPRNTAEPGNPFSQRIEIDIEAGTYELEFGSDIIGAGGGVGSGFLANWTTVMNFGLGSAAGSAAENPLLPIANAVGGWTFGVPVIEAGQQIFIDPLVAVGYDFVSTGLNFASFLIPNPLPGGDDEFTIEFSGYTESISAGTVFNFTDYYVGGIDSFRVTGIDPGAGLDPNDPLAFVSGLTFVGTGLGDVTMTPLTDDTTAVTPEPGSLALMGLGGISLAGGAFRRRLRKGRT